MIEIPLSKTGKHAGKFTAFVDDCDKDLAELSWHICMGHRGVLYAKTNIATAAGHRTFYIHQAVFERMKDGQKLKRNELVDHINMNGLDNRRENLRLATPSDNKANGKLYLNNTSGYKGVSFIKARNKWGAYISINHKKRYLGAFNTPEEAYKAYCEAALAYYADFAKLD